MGHPIGSSDLTYVLGPEDIRIIAADIKSGDINHGPFYLEIHVTDRCSADCYFCNQQWTKREGHELHLADFKEIISHLAKKGLRAVRFSGSGEPTVHPDIEQMLDIVHESGLTVARFDTNGILLSIDISRKLLQYGLKHLHISLQAPTAETWSLVTQREPFIFDRILKNIRDYIAIDKDRLTYICASFVVDEFTFDKVESMVHLCKDMDIQSVVHDLNAYTYSDRFMDECLPIFRDYLANFAISEKLGLRFDNIPALKRFVETMFDGRKSIADESDKLSCLAPWTGALIRANGDVYLCCAICGKDKIIGNIFEEDFMDIWRGARLKSVREEIRTLFFKDPEAGEALKKTLNQRYICSGFCIDCPVKKGIFSNPNLDLMLQGVNTKVVESNA